MCGYKEIFYNWLIFKEEFRSQLNERLPLAMRAMEEATGKTAKELSKMMEEGKLGIDVLPEFGKALRRLANEGGALDKSLKSVRVTENRMITQMQKSSDVVFKSGFGEGLAELYMTIEKIFKDSTPALQKFGATMGRVFKGIAHILKVIEPFFNAFISNLEILTGAYMLMSLGKLTIAFGGLGVAIRAAFLPITAALFALEEIASLMSDKLVGSIETAMGKQINVLNMTQSGFYEKDGKLFSKAATPMQEGFLKGGLQGVGQAFDYTGAGMMFNYVKGLLSDNTPSKGQPASNVTMYIQVDAPSEDVAAGFVDRMKIEALGR